MWFWCDRITRQKGHICNQIPPQKSRKVDLKNPRKNVLASVICTRRHLEELSNASLEHSGIPSKHPMGKSILHFSGSHSRKFRSALHCHQNVKTSWLGSTAHGFCTIFDSIPAAAGVQRGLTCAFAFAFCDEEYSKKTRMMKTKSDSLSSYLLHTNRHPPPSSPPPPQKKPSQRCHDAWMWRAFL